MSRKYKFRNPEAVYFVSFSIVNWIDVFTRFVVIPNVERNPFSIIPAEKPRNTLFVL
jgi:hypothetical protein